MDRIFLLLVPPPLHLHHPLTRDGVKAWSFTSGNRIPKAHSGREQCVLRQDPSVVPQVTRTPTSSPQEGWEPERPSGKNLLVSAHGSHERASPGSFIVQVSYPPTQHVSRPAPFPNCLSLIYPSSRNPRKRPASPIARGLEPTVEPPCKKLRALTDATTIEIRTLSLVPLLKRLQDSLCLPSLIVLRHDRWFIIRQRGPVSLDEPPEFPEDLVTVRVPPGLRIRHPSS